MGGVEIMEMFYYRDKKTGDVYAYDEDQMSVVSKINTPDFDNGREQVPPVFFEIDKKIKSMHRMTPKEIDEHINPKLTKEQLIAQADIQKEYLISEVNTETQILQTKLALKRIKPSELELLNSWLDYLDELEKVDTSTAPDITWPVKP